MRERLSLNFGCFGAIIFAAAFIEGCEDTQSGARHSTAANLTPQAKPSQWSQADQSLIVAVAGEGDDAELAAAFKQAQNTADDARQHWTFGPSEDRALWAIKWAAPLADEPQRSEHVWVRPINWSQFRVEGILATAPISELECGKSLGELVSFPIDQLSDWIHYTGPETGASAADGASHTQPPSAAEHEGGFTVRVLEKRFGTPAD